MPRASSTGRCPRAACSCGTSSSTPRSEFVYRHTWRVGDLVIWDNRATMHRGLPYDDTKYRRELRRVTTLDIPEPAFAAR